MRARLAVKFSLILTTSGSCIPWPLVIQPPQPVTAADVPGDLDEIFSLRLPDEVYFQICKGLISPQVIGWLTSGMIVESQPLADSADYRRFIKDVITDGHTAPRCTTLALLTHALQTQWKQRRVVSLSHLNNPIVAYENSVRTITMIHPTPHRLESPFLLQTR